MQDQQVRSAGDYWAIVVRQRWVILASAFFCWLLVWGVSWLLPYSYQSEATVLVQGQQVSPDLVEPNNMEGLETQLETIKEQVESRPQLQRIIDKYHLYSNRHGLLALLEPGDPVEQMINKDIKMTPNETKATKGGQDTMAGFYIFYSAPTPELAHDVNAVLAQSFVDANNDVQQKSSKNTTDFFKSQLEDAQARLNEQTENVKAFKAKFVGELPDQLASNQQILNGLQVELENNERALSGAQQQRDYLESVIEEYRTAQSDLGAGDSTVSPSTLDKELKDLQVQLAQERSQYTDNYPDVIALKDQIEKTKELKKQMEDQIAAQHKSDKGNDTLSAGSALEVQNGAPTPMMQIQSQLKSNSTELKGLDNAEKDIERQIAEVRKRLEDSPMVEQQLSDISQGYTEASKNYETLLQKSQDSQLASNLQETSNGQQFIIASPANTPSVPSWPNHLLISLGGLAGGLFVGLVLAALLEFANVRIRKETDLEGVISARVLVGIPKMNTPMEIRRRAMLRWVERAAVLAMLIMVVAGNIYAFYKG